MTDQIIIMAGGKGTRMQSEIPKVLTVVKGISIIDRLLNNISGICEKPILIVGHKGQEVIDATKNQYRYIWQGEQLGTGHAIMCAREELQNEDIRNIVVLPGDHPLVSRETVLDLIESHKNSEAIISLVIAKVENFEGDNSVFYNYGRILRNDKNEVCGIIEFKDATEQQKLITELNLSYYCFNAKWLWDNIMKLKNNNNSKEYYLTDILGMAIRQNLKINSITAKDNKEAMGINTQEQMRLVEKYLVD